MKPKYAEYTWEKNTGAWDVGHAKVLRTMAGTTTKTIVAQCDEDEAAIICDALNKAKLPYKD